MGTDGYWTPGMGTGLQGWILDSRDGYWTPGMCTCVHAHVGHAMHLDTASHNGSVYGT